MKDAAGTDLARVVIVCCAADAQPARIHLAGGPAAAAASGFPEDTWLGLGCQKTRLGHRVVRPPVGPETV